MDNHTKEQRHKNMQAVKNRNSQIEILLRHELWRRGFRYRKNTNKVYGHPDIAFISKKIAVFCDSEFWHGFDWENKKKEIKSHQEFWIPKIEKNIRRDSEVNEKLKNDGWIVIRFWGCDIQNNLRHCGDVIEAILMKKKD